MQLLLANPRSEVIKKLNNSKFIENIGQEWIYLTVAEAVAACNFMLHTCKSNPEVECNSQDDNVWITIDQRLESSSLIELNILMYLLASIIYVTEEAPQTILINPEVADKIISRVILSLN